MTFSQLSFSGGGLDRRAHLRDEPKTLTALFENAKNPKPWQIPKHAIISKIKRRSVLGKSHPWDIHDYV